MAKKTQPQVVAAAPATVAPAPTTHVPKTALAKAIFDECLAMDPVPPRKAIIGRFVEEAGLTVKGAGTYLHNLRNKAGLVKHRK